MISVNILYAVVIAALGGVLLGIVLMPRKNRALKRLVESSVIGEVAGKTPGKTSFTKGPIAWVGKMFRNRGLNPPADVVVQVSIFGAPLVGLPLLPLGTTQLRLVGLLIVLGGPALLYLLMARSMSERQKSYAATFPEFLLTLSSAMQSGLSLEQGMRELSQGRKTVAEEVFYEVSRGLSFGESLDESLKRFGKTYKSDDTETLRQATAIGKRTGSSLVHVIESVAHSAIERAKVRREIKALTAEGMMSAYVIIALPFVATAFLLLTNRDYLSVFWESQTGLTLAGVAVGLMVVGWVWMRNMIQGESTKL